MPGFVIMFLIWIKDNNLPACSTSNETKQGGGILTEGKASAGQDVQRRQKGVFWIVILGGALMSVSVWFLLFPYLPAQRHRALQVWSGGPCRARDAAAGSPP